MSDQELEKKTGDEGFVAPETDSQQPVSDVEMEKPVEGEITISLDETDQAIFMQALGALTIKYQNDIKEEADSKDRDGMLIIKHAKRMMPKIDKLMDKFINLCPPDSVDNPDSE